MNTILFWVVHILSVLIHARLWYLEYKHCRHREYFWMPGMMSFLFVSMIPVASTLMAFGGSINYVDNIIKELEDKHDRIH